MNGEALNRGIRAEMKDGILRAGLMVRFMDVLIDTTPEERFSFLEGLIIASDMHAIKNSYPFLRNHIVILGNSLRSKAYQSAFKQFLDPSFDYRYLGENSMDGSAIRGALKVANLRRKPEQNPDYYP